MALFHFHVDQIGRSAGRSAVACAAYRSGEKLYSEYYGETSDYTRKGGVMYSEIMLPPHAPMAYADRQTLWNAVEKAERRHDAQLAYSFDIALQNELTFEENLEVARAFLLQYFVRDGMTVDFCVHDPERDGIQKLGSDNVYQYLLYFDKLYDKFTDAEKKEFLSSFVERVDIYEDELPDGRFLRHIKFKFPVFYNGQEIDEMSWDKESTVETIVLLQRETL